MRKVLFKKWIPMEQELLEGKTFKTIKAGTACWSDFNYGGLFHQWTNTFEESNAGFGNYTVGLIELSDGTIEQVLSTNIKFID